jgi:hypothetical protein
MDRKPDDAAKAKRRLALFLAAQPAQVRPAARPDRLLLDAGDKGTAAFAREIVQAMLREGLIASAGSKLVLSAEGCGFVRRIKGGEDGFQAQHRELAEVRIETPAGVETATANLSESPLGQLVRRKGKDGTPFLTESEWRAGEKLRADYDRGRIMPRLGANWDAAVASGRRHGSAAELTDAALAARQRVDRALDAVGPELAGVLVDICCFLKGLETVEAERGWPVRSAKIVLKTALGVLSRHYDPDVRKRRPGETILHWGAENYRPSIGG